MPEFWKHCWTREAGKLSGKGNVCRNKSTKGKREDEEKFINTQEKGRKSKRERRVKESH